MASHDTRSIHQHLTYNMIYLVDFILFQDAGKPVDLTENYMRPDGDVCLEYKNIFVGERMR